MNMQLRRDSKGRPIGLDWPKAPEFTPEQIENSTKKGVFSGTPWRGGRQRQAFCGQDGKGPHPFPENWRSNGEGKGGYCVKCKSERQAEWRARNPDKVKKARENHYAKVKAKRQKEKSQ